MKQPATSKEELFDELLQDLSPDVEKLAYEFKAFTRARFIPTPTELLRVVLLYCGLYISLREVAGNFTQR